MKVNFINTIKALGIVMLSATVSCSLDDECTKNWYQDLDNDGFGNVTVRKTACTQPDGYVEFFGDTDDSNPAINPGASEIPNNNVDENSDGKYDYILYIDSDADGFGSTVSETISITYPIVNSGDVPPGYSLNSDDCDDNDLTVNPNATEIPNDGKDSNCDGNDNT